MHDPNQTELPQSAPQQTLADRLQEILVRGNFRDATALLSAARERDGNDPAARQEARALEHKLRPDPPALGVAVLGALAIVLVAATTLFH